MAADLTVTAADVRPMAGAKVERFDAGGTLTPGMSVYIASDGDVESTDSDAVGTTWSIGIVVAGADGAVSYSAGDRVDVVVEGPVAGFSSLTPGALGYVSATAGSINDTAGTKSCIVGYAKTDSVFMVRVQLVDLT